MDLSTKYLGLSLKNPIIAAASPLSTQVDSVKELEDNGTAAVVMYSLFEEQINHEAQELDHFLSQGESFAEALSYFPEPAEFHNLQAEEYLDQIAKLKKTVDIPIIGSLNGVSAGGWMEWAKKIQDAGADALELNIFYIPTDPEMTAGKVETMYLDALKTVKSNVSIPVSLKLNPYFSAFANFAGKLSEAGADGLVLFNRFFQPDINLENLTVQHDMELSRPYDLRLAVRWLAILSGQTNCSLAATNGIHTGEDVLKVIMAGADAAMTASELIKNGPGRVKEMLDYMTQWMEKREYNSIEEMKGSMSYAKVAEPAAYTRANYMKTLQSYV